MWGNNAKGPQLGRVVEAQAPQIPGPRVARVVGPLALLVAQQWGWQDASPHLHCTGSLISAVLAACILSSPHLLLFYL